MSNIEPSEEEERAAFNELFREMKGVRPHENPPRRPRKAVDHKKKGKPGRRSPVIDYVRSLDEDYRTTHEVAEILGVSTNLVRKLAKDDATQAPSYVAPFGRTVVRLYTKEDIAELRKHLKERHKVVPRKQYEKQREKERE